MDKLKQILRPGGGQDDQIKYGTPEPQNTHSLGESQDHEDILTAKNEAADRDGAAKIDRADPNTITSSRIVDQKNDIDQQHDTTTPLPGSSTAQSTDPASKTATTSVPRTEPASVEQVKQSNTEDKPGQQCYDGPSGAMPGTAASHLLQQPDDASTMSIKSGKMGPYALDADTAMPGSGQSRVTGSNAVGGVVPSEKTVHSATGDSPESTRDAVLEGAGAAGVGMAGYEAGKYVVDASNKHDSQSVDQPGNVTYTERSYKLGHGALNQATPKTSGPADSSFNAGSSTDLSQSNHAASSGTFFGANTTGQQYGVDEAASSKSHRVRDAAVGGTTAGIGAGALGEYEASKHPDPELKRATYTDRAYHVGGSLAEISPHVPGEFPTEDGRDPHDTRLETDAAIARPGLDAADVGAVDFEAKKDRSDLSSARDSVSARPQFEASDYPIQTTTNTIRRYSSGMREAMPKQHEHNYGRDATVLGGVSATGAGAYEISKDSKMEAATQGHAPHSNQQASSVATQPQPSFIAQSSAPAPVNSTQQEQHHYGQDAAVVGGIGAAGVGAYQLSEDHSKTDLATQGHPPANSQIVPPIITTSQSDMIVQQSTPAPAQPAQQEQHHYGRDAAVVGGTGAAGVGAYELSKDHSITDSFTQGHASAKYQNVPPITTVSQPSTTAHTPVPAHESQQEQHHYGRDAAVVGGGSAAGVGMYELGKDGERPQQPQIMSEKPRTTAVTMTSTVPSATSSNPVDKKTKIQYPIRSWETTSDPHHGQGTAIPGRSTGAAGIGAYEASKRHEHNTASSAFAGQATWQPENHYERDAAVGSGMGAAAAAAYEAAKRHNGDALTSKTGVPQKDQISNFADRRNRPEHATTKATGITDTHKSETANRFDSRVREEDHHHSRDAIAAGDTGAAGLGAYEAYKHGEDHKQDTPSTGSAMTGIQGRKDHTRQARDAAITGGTGVVGTRMYETPKHYEEHEQGKAKSQPLTQHSTTETTTARKGDDCHYGRDAAGASGAGATGIGIHEGAKHHGVKEAAEQQPNPIVAQDSSGHNKLHKKSDTRHQEDKQDHDLQKARERDSATSGDKGEKKDSLLHKILHPGRKSHDDLVRPSQSDTFPTLNAAGSIGTEKVAAMHDRTPNQSNSSEGKVIEPHTGLPIDMSKDRMGGAGGTDASEQIEGYHKINPTEG